MNKRVKAISVFVIAIALMISPEIIAGVNSGAVDVGDQKGDSSSVQGSVMPKKRAPKKVEKSRTPVGRKDRKKKQSEEEKKAEASQTTREDQEGLQNTNRTGSYETAQASTSTTESLPGSTSQPPSVSKTDDSSIPLLLLLGGGGAAAAAGAAALANQSGSSASSNRRDCRPAPTIPSSCLGIGRNTPACNAAIEAYRRWCSCNGGTFDVHLGTCNR